MPFALSLTFQSGAVRVRSFETREEAAHVRQLLLDGKPVKLDMPGIGPQTIAPVNLKEIGEVEEIDEIDPEFPGPLDESTPG